MGLRQVVKREFVTQEALTEMRALGWHIALADGTYGLASSSADVDHTPGVHRTVFFGHRPDVEDACALEQIERTGRGGERLDAMARLGALLGYPPCCTAAYLTQSDQSESASFARLFATGPLEGAPKWNNLFVLSHALISHFPCTLTCDASAELAGATWSRLAESDEARATAVSELLSAPITVWDRFRFIVEHPTQGPLTANCLTDSPFVLSHPPLVSFVENIEQPPPGGVRLHFD